MSVFLTHGYFLSADPREQQLMKPYPPMGLLSISAWLTKEGIPNRVFDTTFSEMKILKDAILKDIPAVAGIYSNLMTKKNVAELISFIRNEKTLKDVKIVIGGPDARYNAADYLLAGADIVIPGEGEKTLTAVIRAIESKNDLSQVEGIIYSDDGNIISTPECRNLNADELPFPARDAIDMMQYLEVWKKRHGYSSITVSGMRGCPCTCNWCSKSVFGNTYRRRDPAHVSGEMSMIKEKYNPDQIWFTDDVFTISKSWLRKFADELEKRSLNIPYECISRSDYIDDDIADLLKRSGCRKIWIGAESGSQKMIDRMNRGICIPRTIDVLRLLKSKGISTGTFIMTGYPGEERKDILETAQFLKRSDPDEVTFGKAYPIKGTTFFKQTEPYFLKPFDWSSASEREIIIQSVHSESFSRFSLSFLRNNYLGRKETHFLKKIRLILKANIARLILSLVP